MNLSYPYFKKYYCASSYTDSYKVDYSMDLKSVAMKLAQGVVVYKSSALRTSVLPY